MASMALSLPYKFYDESPLDPLKKASFPVRWLIRKVQGGVKPPMIKKTFH